MELEEYIKDATDEAMSDYIKSEKYKEHKKQINDLLRNMRENLSSEKMILLNQLLEHLHQKRICRALLKELRCAKRRLDLFERKADAHLDEGSASAFFYSLLLSSVLFFNAIPLTTPRR